MFNHVSGLVSSPGSTPGLGIGLGSGLGTTRPPKGAVNSNNLLYFSTSPFCLFAGSRNLSYLGLGSTVSVGLGC
jgi:hypothetical protein